MPAYLGLDIGSNSVGSAWVDTDSETVKVGVSVFPAGVDEKEESRGAPKNQERRGKRSLRRSLARRSERKRRLRRFLTEQGLLPSDAADLRALFKSDPWDLRRNGLNSALSPHEFGRVLLHLCQRRGAYGLLLPDENESATDGDDSETKAKEKSDNADSDAAVKDAVDRTKKFLAAHNARTFGEAIAAESARRRQPVLTSDGTAKVDVEGMPVQFAGAVRNQHGNFEFHADRAMIRDEFLQLWRKQASFDGELARMLTEDLLRQLDDPRTDGTWRHKGLLFGQRSTYWNMGTLGRCDLEPSDRCVPIADRHASYFRVVESVNNIRLREPFETHFRPLTPEERAAVIARLRSQATGSVAAVRAALGIDKRSLKKSQYSEKDFALNIERDAEREINTDWFQRQIVVNGIGEETWQAWDERKREALNRALLRFDPQHDDDQQRLRGVAAKLGLSEDQIVRLVASWQKRPKLEVRLNLSRRAVRNLLPYMEDFDGQHDRWPTQINARILFAEDRNAKDQTTGEPATAWQTSRYRLGQAALNKAERHYMKKHANELPPAPTLANPVVRKAIHEVRRHVIAYMREFKRKPDRIVIEFAREATKPKKLSDRILFQNRNREKIRKNIVKEIVEPAWGNQILSHNQLRAAVDRVVLCMQQRGVCAYSQKLDGDEKGSCAYSGRPITLFQAAKGQGLEIDHIIPYSRCGDNSLSNRVLCYQDSNRNKAQQTPREWWRDDFDQRATAMRFMDGYKPDKTDYFTQRDYAHKWRNFSRTEVPTEWRGSQLTDTAYSAREVQAYLQQALWPDEESHLAGGVERRILVTKGVYTSILRKDWQLYQRLLREGGASREEVQHASAKNRGDHREHAIDAVAIALTDSKRIQDLARHVARVEEARATGKDAKRVKLPAPWGKDGEFRRQVLSQVYTPFDRSDREGDDNGMGEPLIVVSHRATGRKLVGALHEETLFGPVPGKSTLYTARKSVEQLTPKHLRERHLESPKEAIERIAQKLLTEGAAKDLRACTKLAKGIVESENFTRRHVDPPPEKSGLVRNIRVRRALRREITKRLEGTGRDANTFTKSDLNNILKGGPLRMPSGIPIKRVVLLRTMNDPVVIPRKRWDAATDRMVVDDSPRAPRAYVGGNNHHIEIREDSKGRWSGLIVPTYQAARRVRAEGKEAVDRSDDPAKGGRFIMSLAEGDTVNMRHKASPDAAGYFVVFKLDKPQTIQFKWHWDARRAMGEKDSDGKLIEDSVRDEMPVTAAQLKELAAPGEDSPIKVAIDPLGRPRRLEPLPLRDDAGMAIDPRVMAIAREAIAARRGRDPAAKGGKKEKLLGSWSWMHARLRREGLADKAAQLSAAMRLLRVNE